MERGKKRSDEIWNERSGVGSEPVTEFGDSHTWDNFDESRKLLKCFFIAYILRCMKLNIN